MNSRVWNSIAAKVRILERKEKRRKAHAEISTSDDVIYEESSKMRGCSEPLNSDGLIDVNSQNLPREVEDKALNTDDLIDENSQTLQNLGDENTNQNLKLLVQPLSEEIRRVDCNFQEMVESWKQMAQLVMGTNTTVQNLAMKNQGSDDKMNALTLDFQTKIKRLEQAFDTLQEQFDGRLEEIGCKTDKMDVRMKEAIQQLKDAQVKVACAIETKLKSICSQLISELEVRLRTCIDLALQDGEVPKSGKENRKFHGKKVDKG